MKHVKELITAESRCRQRSRMRARSAKIIFVGVLLLKQTVNHPSFSTTIIMQLMGLASCTRDGGKEARDYLCCYMDIEKIVFEELYKNGLLKQLDSTKVQTLRAISESINETRHCTTYTMNRWDTCQQSQFLADWQHQQVNQTAHPLFPVALGS